MFAEHLGATFTSVQCLCACVQLPKVSYTSGLGAATLINISFLTTEKNWYNQIKRTFSITFHCVYHNVVIPGFDAIHYCFFITK